jgi:hypothetical protein
MYDKSFLFVVLLFFFCMTNFIYKYKYIYKFVYLKNKYFSDYCFKENMTGGNDSTTNLPTSELKLQEVRKDLYF